MGQEFTINSAAIEAKINSLLPSQGGYGAGVDFSASTMIIPIIDLTETASGSGLRQDLQTAFSVNNTNVLVKNATNTVIINTTGYFKVYFNICTATNTTDKLVSLNIFDGTTSKDIFKAGHVSGGNTTSLTLNNEFVIYLTAGESLRCSANSECTVNISTRQIATLADVLVNP